MVYPEKPSHQLLQASILKIVDFQLPWIGVCQVDCQQLVVTSLLSKGGSVMGRLAGI